MIDDQSFMSMPTAVSSFFFPRRISTTVEMF